MMDCDTTGIEPDIALVKYKKLVGEGLLKLVNGTVPAALRKLRTDAAQVQAIVKYINDHETIEGAPGLKPEHLSVFDCAFKPVNGARSIHYMGHGRAQGAAPPLPAPPRRPPSRMARAAPPFLACPMRNPVTMPVAAAAEGIETVYLEGWKPGLK